MRKILYVGWLGFGNLGDELMWDIFAQLASQYLPSADYQLIPSRPGVDLRELSAYDTVVLGGGSLLIPGYLDVAHRAIEQKKRVLVWGTGHDRLDKIEVDSSGKLLTDLSRDQARFGKMLAEIKQEAGYFQVRGPLTSQYMEQLGTSPDGISGDPGLLLPTSMSKLAIDQSQERVIGINWGTSYNKIYGQDEAKVEDALAAAAQALIEHGYRVHLFTMWGPDREANKRLYEKIGRPQQTVLDLTLYNHPAMAALLRRFAATVNFKLHANVISAAVGTPFVCLGYRFKSLDFAYSLGLPQSLVLTDHPQLSATIAQTVLQMIAKRQEIKERLASCQAATATRLATPFRQKLL
ncbi:polysaccharide pyruvyl transferase family protein [Brevibacillus fulvus]|uniref:Polysaccharide pyruvyl transferase WcaK-like protein n=1 Tax=Brevibacillus fulvus TaxID=1125967 RepID=A0A939BUF7_9BACL|nr:polysaccharide pyruvyl transferase family protein [Brevibacillus fulvus]MBM7590419.1 polysaccharide pyruvyl transferase WcaK-like protein [Brevibacillus fulvus]